jgi:hypothetical protein
MEEAGTAMTPVDASEQLRVCARIYEEWHLFARQGDVERLLSLYADDAEFESPLVPAILDDLNSGVLCGRAQIARFLREGTKRRPNELVRWYRSGEYLTNGRLLMWEYPRQMPGGEQIDIMEVMEICGGLIQRHRIYWGWKGCAQIAPSLLRLAENSEDG